MVLSKMFLTTKTQVWSKAKCFIPFAIPNILTQSVMNSANSMGPASGVPVVSGFNNQVQAMQYVAIPAGQMPNFTFNEFIHGGGRFQHGGGFQRGGGNGQTQRGRSRRGRGNFARSRGENDAYSMDIAPFNIFEKPSSPSRIA